MKRFLWGLVLVLGAANLEGVEGTRLGRNASAAASLRTPSTFSDYYSSHVGRGIWKWNVALEVYQRHFAGLNNPDTRLVEIGVQSGGSINMFETLFPSCHYYGVDINKNCMKFQDQRTTIFIGDQASVPSWSSFFATVSSYMDVALDDGGHQAHQMLTTIQQVLPRVRPGGFYCTEDIHGQNGDYLANFLSPAADAIAGLASAAGAQVESVHLYPFMLGVQLAGGQPPALPAASKVTATLQELSAEIPKTLGGTVGLVNPGWGSMLTPVALKNIFGYFYGLYGGVVREEPPHCHGTMSNDCTMIVTNTGQQNFIKAVHVQAHQLLVEIHAQPPVIQARRKGTQWIAYNGP